MLVALAAYILHGAENVYPSGAFRGGEEEGGRWAAKRSDLTAADLSVNSGLDASQRSSYGRGLETAYAKDCPITITAFGSI